MRFRNAWVLSIGLACGGLHEEESRDRDRDRGRDRDKDRVSSEVEAETETEADAALAEDPPEEPGPAREVTPPPVAADPVLRQEAETLAADLVDVSLVAQDTGPAPRTVDEGTRPALEAKLTQLILDHGILPHADLLLERQKTWSHLDAEENLLGLVENLRPKPPLPIEVNSKDWQLVVSFAFAYDTSEDWAWFSNSVAEAARAKGMTTGYLAMGQTQVSVLLQGEEIARVTLPAEDQSDFSQGYLIARTGSAPEVLGHDMTDSVLAQASEYFGVQLTQ